MKESSNLTTEVAIRERWGTVCREAKQNAPGLLALIELASEDPVLGQLFPFISVGRLCFSRCFEYPFYVDVLISQDEDVFVVERTIGQGGCAESEAIGKGSASDSVRIASSFLPKDYGPALAGNADAWRDEFNRVAKKFRRIDVDPGDPLLRIH